MPPPSMLPQFPPTQIQFPMDGVEPALADVANSTRSLKTPLMLDALLDEVTADVEMDERPTALVTLFKRSTASIAGPVLKKSTKMNVG